MWRRTLALVATFLGAYGALPSQVSAETPAPLAPQTLKLPSGPSSLKGLGESFSPNPATGTGAFSVPLEVPPGFLAPEISLQYNGGFGKGPVGNGWRLPVLNIYRTADKGLPRFTENDRFAVAGPSLNDELVLVNEEKRYYRLKNEGAFALFVRNSSDHSWTIRLRDGRSAHLGNTPDARQGNQHGAYRWWVKRVVDRFDHERIYDYLTDSGQTYLAGIRYNEHGGAEFRNEIQFDYETRPDAFADYTYGASSVTALRLREIRAVHGRERVMRTYVLTYEQGVLNSLLRRVKMYGENGYDEMPPITFGYAHHSNTSGNVVAIAAVPAADLLVAGTATLEDVNGDALPDLLIGDAGDYRYYENIDGRRFSTDAIRISNSPDRSLWAAGSVLTDANGDGFRDVLVPHGNDFRFFPGGDIRDGVLVRYGEPRDLRAQSHWSFDWTAPHVRQTDLNFDGRTDLLIQGPGTLRRVLNTKAGELAEESLPAVPLDIDLFDSRVQLLDFNGDGVLDFVRQDISWERAVVEVWHGLGWGVYSTSQRMGGVPEGDGSEYFLQDVNGDGQTDLLWLSGTLIRYFLNDGAGSFIDTGARARGMPRTAVLRQFFGDMNGNGSTDVVWVTTDNELAYLDLMARPFFGLLNRIDNGMGGVTEIDYEMSTAFLVADKLAGRPWKTPITRGVPVIREMRTTDSLDTLGLRSTVTSTLYRYRDGYFDGAEREFRGFAEVIVTSVGDVDVLSQAPGLDGSAIHETQVTRTRFHVGRDLETGADEEILKGKPYAQVVMNGGGQVFSTTETKWEHWWLCQEDMPATITETLLPRCTQYGDLAESKDRLVAFGGQTATLVGSWEKTDKPRYSWNSQTHDIWGNVTEAVQLGEVVFDATRDVGDALHGFRDVGNDAVYAQAAFINTGDPLTWFVGLEMSAEVCDSTGVRRSAKRLFYDAAVGYEDAGVVDTTELTGLLNGVTAEYVSHGLVTRQDAWLDTEDRWIQVTRTAYDNHGLPIVSLDANGNRREFAYDNETHHFLRRESIWVEIGRLDYHADYDRGLGAITDAWDFNEAHSAFEYDELGRLTHVYDAISNVEPVQIYEYLYGSATHPISTVVTYSLVRRETTEAPASYHTGWSFSDGFGRARLSVVQAEAPHQHVASGWQHLSPRGQPVRVCDAFALENVVFSAPPDDTPCTDSALDALDRAVRVQPPQVGSTATYNRTDFVPFETRVYDERDAEESESANAWAYPAITRVDGLGRVVDVVKYNDISGARTELHWGVAYDALGNITEIIDPEGHPRHYEYDSLSRKLSIDDPNAGHIEYRYDDVGNLLHRTDAKRQVIRYHYGLANRVTLTELFDSSDDRRASAEYRFYYDEPRREHPDAQHLLGRISATEGPYDRLYSTYDELGRVTTAWHSVRDRPHGSFDSYAMRTLYDPQGKALSVTYPGDFKVSYGYNGRQLLNRITVEPGSGRALPIVERTVYGPQGQVEQIDFGNGTSTRRGYDRRNRLVELNTGATDSENLFQHLQYGLSTTGLITHVGDLSAPMSGVSRLDAEYGYDRLYQLTSATTVRGTIGYAYDRIQNLVERASDIARLDLPLGTFRYGEYGAGPNQITSAGSKALRYDAVGQMRRYNDFELSYDPLGRLIRAQKSDGSSGTRITNGYDVGGELVVKRVERGDVNEGRPETYRYVFDGYQERRGERVWVIAAGGAKVAEIVESRGLEPTLDVLDALTAYVASGYASAQPAATELLDVDGDRDDWPQSPDADDLELAAQRYVGHGGVSETVLVTRWMHADHLGSPTHTTDSSGTLISHVRFHPYGSESERFGEQPSFGFTGAKREPGAGQELGLVRMGARWLAPGLGRWVSADPLYVASPSQALDSIVELNAYSYVSNDPLNRVDRSGLDDGDALPLEARGGDTIEEPAGNTVVYDGPKLVQGPLPSRWWPEGHHVFTPAGTAWEIWCKQLTNIENIGVFVYHGASLANHDYAWAPVSKRWVSPREQQDSIAEYLRETILAIALAAPVPRTTAPRPGGSTSVYRSTTAAGETQYVGITKNLEARAAAHLRQKGIVIDEIPGLGNLSRADARAVEQVLIEHHGLGKHGGTLMNKINSIAKTNPAYGDALMRGAELLKGAGYPGF